GEALSLRGAIAGRAGGRWGQFGSRKPGEAGGSGRRHAMTRTITMLSSLAVATVLAAGAASTAAGQSVTLKRGYISGDRAEPSSGTVAKRKGGSGARRSGARTRTQKPVST